MNAATHSPSPLAGEGARRADEGAGSASFAVGISRADRDPSSAPSGHLLPQGEKARKDSRHLLPQGEKVTKKDFARHLRRNMTDVEVKLWNALRDRRFENYKFRRQGPIGKYIADFACFEKRLIVELDGSQHEESKRDETRDAWLKSQNFRILRFWNIDINQTLDGCLLAILDALK